MKRIKWAELNLKTTNHTAFATSGRVTRIKWVELNLTTTNQTAFATSGRVKRNKWADLDPTAVHSTNHVPPCVVSGGVKRRQWVERNVNVYGDREWLANVVFDSWDKNGDMTLDEMDVSTILKEADRNRE